MGWDGMNDMGHWSYLDNTGAARQWLRTNSKDLLSVCRNAFEEIQLSTYKILLRSGD